MSITLSLYIARVFTLAVLAMLAGLSGLVGLFDFLELLRRASLRPDAGFGLLLGMAGLRLPWEAMQLLPFAVLIGGILAFWRLTRSSELIVARAAGISAWQFLAAPLACAVGLGLFATMVGSPLSAVMRARAETLENLYLRNGGGPMALPGGQLWVRQSDDQLVRNGTAILHATKVTIAGDKLSAGDVSVFRLDPGDKLIERIEATHAELLPQTWLLESAREVRPGGMPSPAATLHLPTNLTVGRVQDSFAPPDTLSVWALPGFIGLLERAGFSAVRHRLYFQTLLAMPLLAGTMSLVSAGFSMRQTRRGGTAQMIGSGVAAGFLLYLISRLAAEFGQNGAIPPVLAAWTPALSGLMLSVALLLHLEDG
jgi:lipopolysaccharide export system permease protein